MQHTEIFVDPETAQAHEPYVTPEEADKFLQISPVTVKKMAREGHLPAHPIGNGLRKRWRFRISELASHMSSHVNSELSSVRDLRRKSS
jgi:excisionase family DNA binding protein